MAEIETNRKTGVGEASVRNMVYELLRNQILSFQIKPGEMLSENMLSSQMNAGRTQVRDALAQLAEEGYIVVYPQRGTAVSMIDLGRVRQAVTTYMVLEQAMLKEICGMKLEDEQYRQLEDALENQKRKTKKDDTLELIFAERQFHYLLSAVCGRVHVWELFRTMNCDLLRINYLQYSTYNYQVYMSSLTSWEHTQVEGRLLLDNIRRGDAEAAGLICSNHFNGILWNAESLRGIYPQYFSA
ncbi:MAG: GntR family transcriptional regulator [Enterocloster sp.]